jgi:DNA-binding cell septation regulator SpoVG
MGLEITEVRLDTSRASGKHKGTVVVVLNDTIELEGSLVDGANGLFIGWGGREYTGKDGKKKTWAAIRGKSREVSDQFQAAIIARIPKAEPAGFGGAF